MRVGKVESRRDRPSKGAYWGKGRRELAAGEVGGGMRETFSLFVTLELGAEEKSTVKAIKREEGGGRAERELWPSVRRASLHRWPCLVALCEPSDNSSLYGWECASRNLSSPSSPEVGGELLTTSCKTR